jgi:hypothetical protein
MSGVDQQVMLKKTKDEKTRIRNNRAWAVTSRDSGRMWRMPGVLFWNLTCVKYLSARIA